MKKSIVINMKFNNRDVAEGKTKKWIDGRVEVFQNYTLRSLKKQTNQDFLCVIRYDDQTWELIRNALEKYPDLPNNIQFIPESTVIDVIKAYISDTDFFYEVRLDSDDLYHKSYIQQLYDYKPEEDTEILINQKGYIYNSKKDLLKKTFRLSPPFYTFIYSTKDYLDGKIKVLKGGHNTAITFPHEILNKRNFIINIHKYNKSSKFNNVQSSRIKNSKELIKNPLKNKILNRFY